MAVALKDITSRQAIRDAIAEHDRIGRKAFLAKYGFKPAKNFLLVIREPDYREYDSKAIVGVAHGYQFPNAGPLQALDPNFRGGKDTVQPLLERLGFEVRVTRPRRSKPPGSAPTPDEVESAIEGTMTEARYWRRSRSTKLRDSAFAKARGMCCVCDTDFSKVLDGRGVRVLQVHHRKQLSSRTTPSPTKVDELAVVCANCHMLLHLNPDEALDVGELRAMLRPGVR